MRRRLLKVAEKEVVSRRINCQQNIHLEKIQDLLASCSNIHFIQTDMQICRPCLAPVAISADSASKCLACHTPDLNMSLKCGVRRWRFTNDPLSH
jgi:ribosomal protein L40E